MPSGSTRRRCLACPLCIPVSTYEPGLLMLFLTRKSPSFVSSFSASFRHISPTYQNSDFNSSLMVKIAALDSSGLEQSTEASLFNLGWFFKASSNGSVKCLKAKLTKIYWKKSFVLSKKKNYDSINTQLLYYYLNSTVLNCRSYCTVLKRTL